MDNAIEPANEASSTPPLTAAAAQEVDLTGQVLGGFRLLHRLGRGGMGQVYLAEQMALKRKVALKLLHPEMASSERSLQRFKAEAENVARATHANIVQIYDIDVKNGIHYIALEYVEGKNLREFIEKKGTPELSLGLHIMAQVASALQRASELGVIHRDIKPENIMLTKKGEVKVADFGLSRCFDESNPQNLTQSQVVMGTPLYMSPEQVERKPVDTRTDIYSFGVTCYYMFTGSPPFRGNSPIEVAYQHIHNEPPPLADIRPDLPAELCVMIHKMMAKKPEDRYQTAREVLRDISRLRESLNLGTIAAISISSSFLGAGADPLHGSSTQAWTGSLPRRTFWLRAIFAASVLTALAGGFVFSWYHQRSVPPKEVTIVPAIEDPRAANALFNNSERERKMQEDVEKYLDTEDQDKVDVYGGLKHFRDLGLLYLKEKKFDDADKLFKKISSTEPKIEPYRLLGRLGHAIVLAFKDDYAESNKQFLAIMAEFEKIESKGGARVTPKQPPSSKRELPAVDAYRLLWKENPKLREIVAKALNHNWANNKDAFPAAKLDVYRFPPRPVLKAAPMPMP